MNRKIRLLCAEHDREALRPILEALAQKGVRVAGSGEGVTLCALSEAFYADKTCMDALLALIGRGQDGVLPLQLDAAPMPEGIKNALYASNIVSAEGRDAQLIAERILDALPQKKSRLPLLLSLAGVALLAVVGLLIWRGGQKTEETVPVMEIEATAEPGFAIPSWVTQEDLERVVSVVIVGEEARLYTDSEVNNGQYPDWDYYAYRDWQDDAPHWYSQEDGHEYTRTRYDDLRFLQLMPNLRRLSLSLIEAGQLPTLSELPKLQSLMLMDSVIPGLEWVENSTINTIHILNYTGSITDFSPLTTCKKLHSVHLDLMHNVQADLSGFAPARLSWLWINCANDLASIDLSGLRGCENLDSVELENVMLLTDLSFLEGAEKLSFLRIEGLHSLRDISALNGRTRLKTLIIDDCDGIADFSPVAGCTGLEEFHHQSGTGGLRDASFLSELPKLKSIHLGRVELPNLDFLRGIGENEHKIYFSVDGEVGDYAGLAGISTYGELDLGCGSGVTLDRIMPYLQECSIQDMKLHNCQDVDLSLLPRIKGTLQLDGCGISDLTTMPEDWAGNGLRLSNCSRLRSLNGLQNQSSIKNLEVRSCLRLVDWSAIEGMWFSTLTVVGGYSLPSLENVEVTTLRVESVADVEDLSFLDGLDESRAISFELVGLDGLNNLQPLRRFHGIYLSVSPQLMEQAEDLVRAGNFKDYRIEYPEGGWEQDEGSLTLLSWDELTTLPPALLRRVERVYVAGNEIVDPDSFDIWEDWSVRGEHGYPALYLVNRSTGEKKRIGQGSVENLEAFSALTGLKELQLYAQPLRSMDGIQNFNELESLELSFCPELRDISAVFACQQLRRLALNSLDIDSIQGAQNLYALENLSIGGTHVSDLTPLLELPELRYLHVSPDMEEALRSLDGQSLGFELRAD